MALNLQEEETNIKGYNISSVFAGQIVEYNNIKT